MKILYSQIKELAPGLKAGPKEVGSALSLTGFMMDSFAEVKYKNRPDYLIGFEVRQNRADCLSVYGLAKEAAAYYGLKIKLPKTKKIAAAEEKLDIKVEADKFVKRILAVKLTGVKNGESPEWLKEYVAHEGVNSVNLLVDLSNYVMFLTGYPSHLIDFNKVDGRISWSLNHDFNEVTTLSGAKVQLKRDNELIIRDDKKIISLSGLIGGQEAEIDESTNALIAEIAVYDHAIIRKNSRSLNIVTEASHRLEKELDPNGIQSAMELLVALIEEYAGGRVVSHYEYYPKKYVSPTIKFDPASPSQFSGIEIPGKTALKIFKDLNFSVKKSGSSLLITPPTYRQDIKLPEDLVEEVIRIYGYDKIPANEAPKLRVVPDITPKNIILAEKIRDTLTVLGFDEILSWPLTKREDNALANYLDWRTIVAQNSINDLYPNLRQSIASGLLIQLDEYVKKNLKFINIFEIGKVFGEKGGKYLEHESFGILSATAEKSLTAFKNNLETLLRSLGFSDLKYFSSKTKPALANPESAWDIYANGKVVGIIYKLTPRADKLNTYFAEINLTLITAELAALKNNPVVELTQKLIYLDANIELDKNQSVYEYLGQLEKKLDKNHLWSLNVADIYPLENKIRYTIRAAYKELSDQEAKKIHLSVFDL